jgi:hypothetical protein
MKCLSTKEWNQLRLRGSASTPPHGFGPEFFNRIGRLTAASRSATAFNPQVQIRGRLVALFAADSPLRNRPGGMKRVSMGSAGI